MKKMVCLVGVALMATLSCQKTESHKKAPDVILLATLNGIDQTIASKMEHHFMEYRDNDTQPLNTNVWFDSTTVHRIVSLLEKEGADGLRIYFISDLGTNASHLKNSVALVSTRTSGIDISVPSGTTHKDYYEHDAADALFTNRMAIRGAVSNATQSPAAALYTSSVSNQPDNVDYSANPHHISKQLAVHMAREFGNHPINTTSEWFDLKLFQSFAKDSNADGLRIYFSTKPQDGTATAGMDAFVLTKTMQGTSPGMHVDIFNNTIHHGKIGQITDDGNDNGELCPTHCQ